MNQMSSSLDSHWSNRRNGPRENKRTPEEQEKELKEHQGFSKASSPVSAESMDSPGTSLPQARFKKSRKRGGGVTEDVLVRFKEGYDQLVDCWELSLLYIRNMPF
ncbi:hypothetical protein VNO80_33972 [Phaseolus coccineus]|uniref:Uncharacterized protein n=1 Tax=Phaseolus coccineus TaxID=3886 RepID=A0AAN9KXI6_PHACN